MKPPGDTNADVLGHATKRAPGEESLMPALCAAFTNSSLSLSYKLQGFSRHVRRQDVARFLAKYELFRLALPVNGSIVECGVFTGAGVFNWLHFSSILEPYNHTRKIIGFDTFSGFPSIHAEDLKAGGSEHLHPGGLSTSKTIQKEIEELAELHDQNRPLGHVSKVQLVEGNACETIPRFVEANPHLLISLIYLDFDIYEPTKAALEYLYPRVVKGGVIAFDELNCPEFPGETTALLSHLDLQQVRLQRFPHDPYLSFFIKG
jgi:hypothetical protein